MESWEIGGTYDIIQMNLLTYAGTDPAMLANIESFNACFSLVFSLGMFALLPIMVVLVISRS